jgi:hypothetical protein
LCLLELEFEEVTPLLDGAEAAFLERRAPHLLYT